MRKIHTTLSGCILVALAIMPSDAHCDLVGLLQFDRPNISGHQAANDPYIRSIKYIGHPAMAESRNGNAGNAGNAIDLDGIDDCVRLYPVSEVKMTHQFTVSAWIKVPPYDDERSSQYIASKSGSWNLSTRDSASSIEFLCNGIQVFEGPASVVGSVNLASGKWHHVVGTFDGQSLSLFVNGTLAGRIPATGSINGNPNPILVGRKAGRRGQYFKGMMDEIAFFDHGMAASDVRVLQEKGPKSFFSESSASLVKAWREYRSATREGNTRKSRKVLQRGISLSDAVWAEQGFPLSAQTGNMVMMKMYGELIRIKEDAGENDEQLLRLYEKVVRFPMFMERYVPALLRHNELRTLHLVVEYCKAHSDLGRPLLDLLAREASRQVSKKHYKKSLAIYDLCIEFCESQRWESDQFEFKKARALFKDRQYREAARGWDSFIQLYYHPNDGQSSDTVMMRNAWMYKGLTHILLKEGKEALHAFKTLSADFPSIEPWETAYYLGYANMLQGFDGEAREVLGTVVKQYPESVFAIKAQLCLQRLNLIQNELVGN